MIINVGPRWLVAELADAGAVGALAPDMQILTELSNRLSIGGVTVYGDASDGKSAIHVRSFAPAHASQRTLFAGSGNISVAPINKDGTTERVGTRYTARQGCSGPRWIRLIRIENGKIFLGGNAVTCVEGTLRLD